MGARPDPAWRNLSVALRGSAVQGKDRHSLVLSWQAGKVARRGLRVNTETPTATTPHRHCEKPLTTLTGVEDNDPDFEQLVGAG